MSRIAAVLVLALTYLFALASFDPWDALAGVLVGAGALAVGARLPAAPAAPRAATSPLRFLRGLAAVVWDTLREITVGTWQVTLVVLHVRPLVEPGIVAVPIGDRSRAGVATEALVATLAPGEFLVEVDWERGVMLFHVLDARDPDAVRRRHEEYYERRQRAVVP